MTTSPFVILPTAADLIVLTRRANSACAEHRQVIRAKIVLAAAQGCTNAAIAAELDLHVDTVRKWRKRYARSGLAGLMDLPRSGRPPVFTPVQVAQVKALACTPPADSGLPLARWSVLELAVEAVSQGVTPSISPSTISRWLAKDAIKPWQHRSWIFPRDPDFATKAGVVLDLYDRRWQGVELGDDEYVISADEKSQLQALRRRHPGLPAGPGRTRRVEFEYRRGGTLAYFAAYDVHHAHVIGTIAPKTGIAPFADLVHQVMTTEPYASARRVFWVVDNGSSHNGERSIERMNQAWPTATLVHLPVHASWLNEVEIYFSILQRKAIATGDFADLDDLATRILAFQQRYNATASPFDWKYTRHDLNDYLARLRRHDNNPEELTTPQAA
ncbi:IS630 family transposase [Ammonicoccus fulvus]|uniref:IS630 family transposase n=1 Tax=Ammonicoccus fulvus TaxID=3138240 RepID=A0ABZ3FNN6_9ACTN